MIKRRNYLVGRIMDQQEFDNFLKKGVVESSQSKRKRLWDERNPSGKKGDYTFFSLNNRSNILFNMSSVVDFFERHPRTCFRNKANVLVVFKTYDRSHEIYRGFYHASSPCYEGECGYFGVDCSKEFSVPCYNGADFKLVKAVPVTPKRVKKELFKILSELGKVKYASVEDFYAEAYTLQKDTNWSEPDWSYLDEYDDDYDGYYE